MKIDSKTFGLVFIGSVILFVGYLTYNTIFYIENIYSADFINEGSFVLPEDVFHKISGDKMYVIIMKRGGQGDYSGQIMTGDVVYNFSGYARNTILGHSGSDDLIAQIGLSKVKTFSIVMDQKDSAPYTLIVQTSKYKEARSREVNVKK